MKIEQQVVSLELAKQLKELGVPQDSLFYWEGNEEYGYKVVYEYRPSNTFVDGMESYSAFTVAELGEMLPNNGSCVSFNCYQGRGSFNQWICKWIGKTNKDGMTAPFSNLYAKTEADARAKMLIWLIENKYIDLKQGNK